MIDFLIRSRENIDHDILEISSEATFALYELQTAKDSAFSERSKKPIKETYRENNLKRPRENEHTSEQDLNHKKHKITHNNEKFFKQKLNSHDKPDINLYKTTKHNL